jgi:hypothetical protein
MVDLWRSGRNGGGGRELEGEERHREDRLRWSGNHINNSIVGGEYLQGLNIRSVIKDEMIYNYNSLQS